MEYLTDPIMTCVLSVPITVLRVPSKALTVCEEGRKSVGENPSAMEVTNGHTFKVEPLSSRTYDTRRPEQATLMNKG